MGDLSTNFSREEFACPCGCGQGFRVGDIDPGFILRLEEIREELGRPLFVNSGCRCPAHNAAVGGVNGSVHTMIPLEAGDFRVYPGPHKYLMHKLAYKHEAMGVGMANTYIHMDWHDGSVKARPANWHY